MDRKFPKSERIFLKRDIQHLFEEGKHFFCAGFKCVYVFGNGTGCNRIMISVPKKIFKQAVRRNRLKRRIREAYRLNKGQLAASECDLLIIYLSKNVRDSESIASGIREILARLSQTACTHDCPDIQESSVLPADSSGTVL